VASQTKTLASTVSSSDQLVVQRCCYQYSVQLCFAAVHKKSRQVIRVTTASSNELTPSSASETP